MNPFAKKRPNQKRDTPRRVGSDRVKLTQREYEELRFEAYRRSEARCECGCGKRASYFLRRPHPDAGEFAHDEHGSRKSDELHRGRWLNWQCHDASHNAGGHPCPRRPGSVMSLKAAEAYWNGEICIGCSTAEQSRPKKARESFCGECRAKLQPQTAHDLENSDSARDYCEALARGELEIIAADVRAKVS